MTRRVHFPNDERVRQVLDILRAHAHDAGCAAAEIAMRDADVDHHDELVFDLDDGDCAAAARVVSGYAIIGKACLYFSEAPYVEGPTP